MSKIYKVIDKIYITVLALLVIFLLVGLLGMLTLIITNDYNNPLMSLFGFQSVFTSVSFLVTIVFRNWFIWVFKD